MQGKEPISQNGLDKLKEKLNNLKNIERPSVIKAIAQARELGDLSENAEYKSSREKQSFIEGEIATLEEQVVNSEIVDVSKVKHDDVRFGAIVLVTDLDTDEKFTYQIVGKYESDYNSGKISLYSPVARGLIGKTVGDIVTIKTPGGEKEFEIIEMNY